MAEPQTRVESPVPHTVTLTSTADYIVREIIALRAREMPDAEPIPFEVAVMQLIDLGAQALGYTLVRHG